MSSRPGFLSKTLHGLMALIVLAASVSWTFQPVSARESGEESEPRVVLGGDQAVHAGELVELRWTRADEVRELEILLSQDGGRTYATCISPQLDPSLCHFTWRVPANIGADLRLRIRYNKDGREIEGPPTKPLALGAAHPLEGTPLGLPAAPRAENSGREGSTGVTVTEQSLDSRNDVQHPRLAAERTARELPAARARCMPQILHTTPVSFPLRA